MNPDPHCRDPGGTPRLAAPLGFCIKGPNPQNEIRTLKASLSRLIGEEDGSIFDMETAIRAMGEAIASHAGALQFGVLDGLGGRQTSAALASPPSASTGQPQIVARS